MNSLGSGVEATGASLMVKRLVDWRSNLLAFALLVFSLWVGRYWYSQEYGLYEDDYTRTPQALAMSLPQIGQQVAYALTHFTEHAKPLHSVFIYTFSYLGGKLGGLQGVYWIGFGLTLLATWLFYRLLCRLASPAFALVGGLAYCLYCADTTQVFLTHSLVLQPSLILLLLAFHAYLSAKKGWAYLLAGLILFTYETPFPVFLAAPLLTLEWTPRWRKEAVWHIVWVAGMLAAVILLRKWIGEGRVSELDARTAITLPVNHMFFGPWFSLKALASKAYQVTRNLKPEMVTAMAVALPLYTLALLAAPFEHILQPWWRSNLPFKTWLKAVGQALQPLARLALIGLALLILAYPLTFTIDVGAIDGRDSRVHFAAVVGASWLVACAGALGLQLARALLHKLLGAACLAAFFSLLLAYGFVIQGDYALAWQLQRSFWTQLLPLVRDAGDGTVILVEPSAPRTTGQIGVLTWNTPRVLDLIYTFPTDWQSSPRVYRLEPGWETALADEDEQFQINEQTSFVPESLFLSVESSQVILIEVQEGQLIRRSTPLTLEEHVYPLKQPAATEVVYPPGPLYPWIILPGPPQP